MRRTTRIGLAGAGTCALLMGITSPAFADYAPAASDVVGVGSDTVQNIMDFVADGDQNSNPGFNTAGNINKLVSFDATPDSNDRAGYLTPSTISSPNPLNPTIVLRGNTTPVPRPNGSGAGIAAILADTGAVEKINYVRASRLPSSTELQTMQNNQSTTLHAVQIAQDPLEIAYASAASNIPAAGLSTAQLKLIYNCTDTTWTQVGGTSTSTIVPLIPQTGSGTRSTFLSDIGLTAPGACAQTVEENDPASITTNAAAADAIVPFSAGRLGLYNSAVPYFHSPTTPFGAIVAGITLQQGFQADGVTHRVSSDGVNNVYDNVRGLYILFRDRDSADSAWQPGGTKNWVNTLFVGTNPYVAKSSTQALIASAGAIPAYSDLGPNS